MDLAVMDTDVSDEMRDTGGFFLLHQPILNRKQTLVAYGLSFRDESQGLNGDDKKSVTAAVVKDSTEKGMRNVVGSSLAFLCVDAEVLMNDAIFTLARQRIVLEIPQTLNLTVKLMERIEMLFEAGYRFAVADVVAYSYRTDLLMPFVNVVKIDVFDLPEVKIAALGKYFKSKKKILLADKVAVVDKFKLCKKHGFHFFQGYYFAQPEVIKGKQVSQLSLRVMYILTLIANGNNNFEIVRAIDQDVVLKEMLLHLFNTPLCGFTRRIESLDHLLLVLGHRQLKRLLHIVLYANRLGAACSALMTLAATRGRLCELLAEAIQPRCYIKPYVAFTVGALSFADVVLNLDVANIVDQIGESSEVCGALNARAGVYGDLLTLVELYEMPELFDADKINRLLDQFQLSKREFFHMQKQAFSWGSSISEYMSIQLADQ